MSSLVEIFENTMSKCRTDRELSESIKNSLKGQKIIFEMDSLKCTSDFNGSGNICISKNRTIQVAQRYSKRKVCILNFASACNPGGGVANGAHAQEEGLCRISTLYSCLNINQNWDKFYQPHRHLNSLYNSEIIYTPGVTVFKSDTENPVMLDRREWFHIDVITCAAPNILGYEGKINSVDIQKIFEKCFERVVLTAEQYGCEVLILGAFGCGAFGNNPNIVAAAACKIMKEYRHCFNMVEFAIYSKFGNENNYQVFREYLGRIL